MRRFVILAVALTLPAGGCMMKPRHLVYPQGVTFQGWYVPNFESVHWRPGPNNPGPCPLVVHRRAGDLTADTFADPNRLKREGWTEQDVGNGSIILTEPAPRPAVSCAYQGGALAHVSVSVLSGGTVEVSLGGKRVELPATDEAIATALGQPLRRE